MQKIPVISNYVDIKALGVDTTGNTDVSAMTNAQINAATPGTELYFGPGVYLFTNSIKLKSNVSIRGAGAATKFIVQMTSPDDFIKIHGTESTAMISLTADAILGDSSLSTGNTPLALNAYYRLRFVDDSLMYSTWAYGNAGQIYKVVVSTLGIPYGVKTDAQHRYNYTVSKGAFLQELNPIENAGVSCLSIEIKDSSTSQLRNISIKCAENCWVTGVSSYKTNFGHIVLENSRHCTISGNYLRYSFGYGGGGRAYGVVCQDGACENKIEDNIFEHLRHSMLIQAGANGNVYAYNYSADPFWSEAISNACGDISIHGNYPYFNLFEGNVVSHIWSDNSHGKQGPFNCFFRNRMYNYGFTITSGDSLTIVNNEVMQSTPFVGSWNLGTTLNSYVHGNRVKQSNGAFATMAAGTNLHTELSLYTNSKPTYLWNTGSTWPIIGISGSEGAFTNAAEARYNGDSKTRCTDIPQKLLNNTPNIFDAVVHAHQILVSIKGLTQSQQLLVYNMHGQIVARIPIASGDSKLTIDVSSYARGVYTIKLSNIGAYKKIAL